MGDTIRCEVFGYPDIERVEAYFTARGLEFSEHISGQLFFVELIQKPAVLKQLEIAIGKIAPHEETWQLMWASSAGLLFYIAYAPGDGYVFIVSTMGLKPSPSGESFRF